MSKRTAWTCVGLFFASQAVFLFRIQQPHGYSFDEVFYIPAAEGFLTWTANLNRQHPPLAKYLIALGMKVFGDDPLGWRVMSSVFGGLTVAGMYAWALAVLRQQRTAVWVAAITLTNQILYIHARTGMLEIFLFGFMVWGLAAFCAAWSSTVEPRQARRLLVFAGTMFGLTTACKWLGVVPWGGALGLVMVGKLIQRFRPFQPREGQPTRLPAGDEPWINADVLPGVGAGTILLALVVAPLAAYWATFLPLLWMPPPDGSWHGLWQHQVRIWQERGIVGPPVQITRWYQWPLNTHPMLYWYQGYGWETARAVILRGNPVVLWSGLAALAVCAWQWLKTGSRQAFLTVFWYCALYLCWSVIPRKTTFYYYYYPAAMALTLALGYAVQRWPDFRLLGVRWQWVFTAAAVIGFLILLPTSSAMRIPSSWLPW